MLGIDGAASVVGSTLAANLPAKITELETRLNLVAGTIGQPGRIEEYPQPPETLALSDYPAVMVDALETMSLMPLDIVNGNLSYLGRYSLRTYVWVRDQEFSNVALKVRRYMLGVREVLLNNQGLMTTGARVDDSTFKESYSDVASDDKRAIAAAFLEFQVTLEELLTSPPEATADTIDTPLSLLPVTVQQVP